MELHLTISEAVADFRRKAAPLMAVSDLLALRALYSRQVADARAANKENQGAAKEMLRETLLDVLMEPSRRVKTGWFDDM